MFLVNTVYLLLDPELLGRFTQISFENVTQEKVHNRSYSRRSPWSSFSYLTQTQTLILSDGLYKVN